MLLSKLFFPIESGSKASAPCLTKSTSRETLILQNSGGNARTPSKEILSSTPTAPGSRENTPITAAFLRSTSKEKSNVHNNERFVI